MRAEEPCMNWSLLEPKLEELRIVYEAGRNDLMIEKLKEIVPEFNNQNTESPINRH